MPSQNITRQLMVPKERTVIIEAKTARRQSQAPQAQPRACPRCALETASEIRTTPIRPFAGEQGDQ